MPSASGTTPRTLGEIRDIYPPEVPDDEDVAQLREIRHGVERTFNATGEAFAQCDRDVAVTLLRQTRRAPRYVDKTVDLLESQAAHHSLAPA